MTISTIEHNTVLPLSHSTYHVEGKPPLTRFALVDNILGYGVNGLKVQFWFRERTHWLPDAVIRGNALVSVEGTLEAGPSAERGVSGRALPYVFFRSRAAAGLEPDGRLHADSSLKGFGTRSTDVGVSFRELCDAVRPACETIQTE